MEPNTQQPQNNIKPVMDVVPPPKPAGTSAPADGVKTPPPANDTVSAPEHPDLKEQARPKAPKQPKVPRSGVGLAVAATIVITFGLAVLFVYAYLRTNNISVF